MGESSINKTLTLNVASPVSIPPFNTPPLSLAVIVMLAFPIDLYEEHKKFYNESELSLDSTRTRCAC